MQKAIDAAKKIQRGETNLPADMKTVSDLQTKIADLQAQIQNINQQLNQLDTVSEKIAALDNYIDFLNKKIALAGPNGDATQELKKNLEKAQAQKRSLQQQQETTKAQQDDLNSQKQNANEQIRQLQAALAEQLNNNQGGNGQQGKSIEELQQEATRITNDLVNGRANLHDKIGGIFVDPHPRNAVANMDDGIPFLMLPVRIETCFVKYRPKQ